MLRRAASGRGSQQKKLELPYGTRCKQSCIPPRTFRSEVGVQHASLDVRRKIRTDANSNMHTRAGAMWDRSTSDSSATALQAKTAPHLCMADHISGTVLRRRARLPKHLWAISRRSVPTILHNSPVGSVTSNGVCERTIQEVTSLVHCLGVTIKTATSVQVGPSSPMLS